MCYYSNSTGKELTKREAARISARNEELFIEFERTGNPAILDGIEHIIRIKG